MTLSDASPGPGAQPGVDYYRLPDWLQHDTLGQSVYRDGIGFTPGLMPPQFAVQAGCDALLYFDEARAAGKATGRGPNRFYWPMPPERLTCFEEIFRAVLPTAMRLLGPDALLCELGFDAPIIDPRLGPDGWAKPQPIHRDAPLPELRHGLSDTLVVNFTTVPVTEDHGPFEYWPGTHQMQYGPDELLHGMFAFPELDAELSAAGPNRSLGQPGGASWRLYTMLHRGSRAKYTRPVGIMGFCLPYSITDSNQIVVSRRWLDRLPADLEPHIRVTGVVEGPVRPYGQRRPDLEELMSTPDVLATRMAAGRLPRQS
jgi:hypothetical protein